MDWRHNPEWVNVIEKGKQLQVGLFPSPLLDLQYRSVQLFFALGLACRACKIVVTVFGKRNQVTLVRVIQAQHAAAASSSGPEQSQDLGRTRRSPVGLEDGRLASVHPGLIQADKVEL